MGQQVVIVGGGPAGAAAAITLLRNDVEVLLLEPTSVAGNKLSETLYPEARAALSSLGLNPTEKRPLTASYIGRDGKTRLRLSLDCEIGSVDRNELDSSLREVATQAGAQLLPLRVDKVESSSDGVAVHAQDEIFQGSYLIDASGKNPVSLVTSEVKSAPDILDRRFNAFSHFERSAGFDIDDWTIVALEEGFAYVLPIRAERICVGITSYAAFGTTALEEAYVGQLSRCEFLNALTKDARRVLPVIPAKNVETMNPAVSSGRILRVGDALGFRDPFLWDGLSFALETGKAAAHLCAQKANAEKRELKDYSELLRSLEARIRRQAYDHYKRIMGQFNDTMSFDPHVSPMLMGSLFSLTGDRAAGELANVRSKLNIRGTAR
jgi:menaquinone-9 beta-reductase